MADLYRLNRRTFINQLGGSTIAVAILGSGVLAACSEDGAVVPVSQSSAPDPGSDSTSTSTTTSAQSTGVNPDSDTVAMRWQRVEMGGVSAYLIARGNEVAVVDTGFKNNIDKFDGALSAIGAQWGDVKHVILTHKHPDHVGGLPEVVELAGQATVYIGEADLSGAGDIAAQPVNDGEEIFGLQIIGTPGHTLGHISVLDPDAGFLVVGDAMNEENGMVLGPNPQFTPDMATANESVKRLAEREFETIVFGHGNPFEGGASKAVVALAQTL